MDHRPKYLSAAEANQLYDEVMAAVDWVAGQYTFSGKTQRTPRLLGAMKDKGESTPYYKVTGFVPWTPLMRQLKERLEQETGIVFRYAQLNLYRDGRDYIGWHADREVQPGDHVVSVSLGATRRFIFRRKDKHSDKKEFSLRSGDLFIMNHATSTRDLEHTVPVESRPTGPRISATFRDK